MTKKQKTNNIIFYLGLVYNNETASCDRQEKVNDPVKYTHNLNLPTPHPHPPDQLPPPIKNHIYAPICTPKW